MRFITSRSPVKPCLVKYFKWLLKVVKEFAKELPKGTFCFQTSLQRAQFPSVEA